MSPEVIKKECCALEILKEEHLTTLRQVIIQFINGAFYDGINDLTVTVFSGDSFGIWLDFIEEVVTQPKGPTCGTPWVPGADSHQNYKALQKILRGLGDFNLERLRKCPFIIPSEFEPKRKIGEFVLRMEVSVWKVKLKKDNFKK